MSYSSSREASLIKVERDNSLSCSLELATLVIPWEIFYVLCIKFVSLSALHAHTFLLLLLQLCLCCLCASFDMLSFFYLLICSYILFLLQLSSVFPFYCPHTWFIHLFFLSSPPYLCLYILLSEFDLPLPFCLSPPLFLPLLTQYCISLQRWIQKPPCWPCQPFIAQLAGLID